MDSLPEVMLVCSCDLFSAGRDFFSVGKRQELCAAGLWSVEKQIRQWLCRGLPYEDKFSPIQWTHKHAHTHIRTHTLTLKIQQLEANRATRKTINTVGRYLTTQSSCWNIPLLSFETKLTLCLPLLTQLRCNAQSSNQNTNQSHSCNRSSTFQVLGAAGNRKKKEQESSFFIVVIWCFVKHCTLLLALVKWF